jgi:hypothetical protein
MSKAKTASGDAWPHDGGLHNQSSGRAAVRVRATSNWHWHDPPILFPVFLVLLIVGYVVLRVPQ